MSESWLGSVDVDDVGVTRNFSPEILNEIDKFIRFSERSVQFAVYPGLGLAQGMIYEAIGLVDESAELLEVLVNHGDLEKIAFEAGDVLWYLARLQQSVIREVYDDALPRLSMRTMSLREFQRRWLSSVMQDVYFDGSLDDMAGKKFTHLLHFDGAHILGRAKKVMRQDKDSHGHLLLAAFRRIPRILSAVYRIVQLHSDRSFESVMELNLAKLGNRRERAAIKGEGDHR